ncbi:MAG: methylenetetrahydrofolate reductase [Desulfobacteraceae bacterium]
MKLRDALSDRKFVVTSEIQAPIDEEPETLIQRLDQVRGRLDGITVPELDLEGVVGDTIKTCEILKKNRFETIYQTTTRDKPRPQLQKDLLSAHHAGVENLLVFTEDYRITGDSLQEMMFFHVDSGKLASVLDHLREGVGVDETALPGPAEFVVGAGVESRWGKDVPDLEKREMEEMARIGSGYFLTTPVFDLERFEKFMRQVGGFGIPVIAEVLILRTAGMARFLNRHVKSGLVPEHVIRKLAGSLDRQKASIELFTEIVSGLKDLCQGIHIITIGGEEKLRQYLDAARLKRL